MNNIKVNKIITEIVLNQEGKFFVKDVLSKVKPLVDKEFTTIEELESYIIKKLDSMCEMGLLAKTSVYYFSI